MARYEQSVLDSLKSETDIVRLIESYGTKLKSRNGDELIGLCPLHNDTAPSLVVNRRKKVWNCLGACNTGGDVIQWVMKAEKVSFRHAVELLQEGAVGSLGTTGKSKYVRRLESPLEAEAADYQLLGQVTDYYHSRLKESPKALEYLESRNIASAEAIDQFKIGYSDRSLGLRLPVADTQAGKAIRDRLKKLGVIRAKTGHEAMRGCITFPFFLEGNRVSEIYGRRISNPSRGASVHWYLDGPHVGVWNEAAFKSTDEIILCESIIDAMSFWTHGFRNVTASFGVNGFTDDILNAMVRNNIKRILIAYDNDDAGNKGADELSNQLQQQNFETFRIRVTPTAKDINGYARIAAKGTAKHDNANNWLGLLVRNATWLGKGKAPELSTPLPEIFQGKTPLASETKKQTETKSKPATKKKNESQPDASASEQVEADGKRAAKKKNESSIESQTESKQLPLLAAETAAADDSPTASPVPAAPNEIEATIKDKEIIIEIGNRIWRVRGLEKNLAFDILKVNVLVRSGEQFHIDTLDLYAARVRSLFIKEASRELGFEPDVIKRDLGKVLLKLEALQDEQIQNATAVKENKIELSDKDKQSALELLQQPNLIERILADFAACGVVGEETNKLVGYLAATSRKLDKPLAVVIQSSSAAGKSSLMDAILRFIPNEEQVGYSAMTGQSLFYMGGMELKNKILSIAEEEGVAQASYALKLLQSEGELTIASTGKDPGTGRMETQEYHVEGPVMIFLTTTAIDIDEELLNRCVVLTVDENRDQTRAIHDQQRQNETLEGLLAKECSTDVRRLHQNAQRLIRPLLVVNPFAAELSFVDDRARRRRDHMKYLTLIRSIALLHQYQREIKTVTVGSKSVQYIEVQRTDIVLANRLADQILGRSIDELPPQTRRLLIELHNLVSKECKSQKLTQNEFRFTRRFIRESLGWSQTALRKHIERLLEMEYMIPHRDGGRRTQYELLYDGRGREGQPTMCGLIDVKKLSKQKTTTNGSSPLNGSSSPLSLVSSPSDHPNVTRSSPQTAEANHEKTNGKPR